jgi:hypothetical protein
VVRGPWPLARSVLHPPYFLNGFQTKHATASCLINWYSPGPRRVPYKLVLAHRPELSYRPVPPMSPGKNAMPAGGDAVRSTGIASWQAQQQEGAARRSGKGRLAVTSPRLPLFQISNGDSVRPPRQSGQWAWGHRSVFMSLAQQLFLQAQVHSPQSKGLSCPSLIIFFSRPCRVRVNKGSQVFRNSK